MDPITPTTPSRSGGAMLPAAKLWRRVSGRGIEYLAGRLGGVRVLILPKRDGEPGDHSHVLLFAEAPQRGEGGRDA
ncbi:hypothetical protein GCM10010964_22470 [Caldovatus sediminis]|uniref:Uncharacterized protein n=1 Tax=Caldovatus sediminis TaxID=2041189 RepID=A0A8J2ZBU0_9PROT|nr:hypothetical protein [Caldovatus sediminis]GGG34038.1 hypothetical protein GCM10010964_22470 [Caldovatus sediminis]